ncbi:MAG: DUF4405 domain-containing protein [Candidatus Micrarchaeia archaeon]
MDTNKVNYFVDVLMILLFIVVSISGLVLFFVLPGGGRFAGQADLFGIARHTYANMHELFGLLFIALLLVHIVFHLKWVMGMSKVLLAKKDNEKKQ